MPAEASPTNSAPWEHGRRTPNASGPTECQVSSGAAARSSAASIRSANHVSESALAGADVVTAPPNVLKALANHPLTDKGLETFLKDWEATGQKIL